MHQNIDGMKRRDFLRHAALFAGVAGVTSSGLRAWADDGVNKRSFKKGIMWGTVSVKGSVLEKMKAVKAAGYDGAEMNSHMNQDEVLKARDEVGLEIPSVCDDRHWAKPLSDPDPAVRAEGLAALQQTLRDAKRYGAKSILLVPAVVTKQTSYAEAYERSKAEIRKAIPLAEELGVKISLENVWNKFLLSPMEAARFVDEFNSPMVGWHFDVGNIMNFGFPEQWIRILGKRINMIHIKEFSLKKRDKEGLWAGFQVSLLEGDNDWPTVMKAIDECGYRGGWVITEQGGGDTQEGLNDLSSRLSRIIAS
jgi:hexulose-6-phosphate isomerase